MKLKISEILKPTLVLGAVCLVSAAALVGVNMLTRDKIAQAQLDTAISSRKIVLSSAEEFEEADGYSIGMLDGEVVGYVFETEAKGYGGSVKVMTGILEDGTVGGIVILDHSETPGLGANAENDSFRNQYIDKDIAQEDLKVVKGGTAGNSGVQAMTGASITSTAVTNAVNKAGEEFRSIKEGAEK